MAETRRASIRLNAPLRDVRLRGEAPRAPEPARAPADDPAVSRAARALTAAAVELKRRVESLEAQAEPQILELVKAIAQEVTRAEVKAGNYDLAAIVRDALAVARGTERGAVVCLNPEDYGQAAPSGVLREADSSSITLRPDSSVALGGCRVETPFGAVARDVTHALADVLAAVDGKR